MSQDLPHYFVDLIDELSKIGEYFPKLPRFGRRQNLELTSLCSWNERIAKIPKTLNKVGKHYCEWCVWRYVHD